VAADLWTKPISLSQ